MSQLAYLNPGGQQVRRATALQINIGAARGLQGVLQPNLGPKGTMKMLVSGAGLIKITKDGNTLLGEMQIQHPTAALIARAATATDDVTGDGSTSTVVVIGEMMRQCERYIQEGLHPRLLTEGFETAKTEAVRFLLAHGKVPVDTSIDAPGLKETLHAVATTTLATKVGPHATAGLADAVVDAVLAVRGSGNAGDGSDIDLHMVEVMHMKNRMSSETTFLSGIVLDHGARHDSMPQSLENCFILTCNVSLEWERSELGSAFYYSDPTKKAKLAEAERKVTDEKVQKVIDLKNLVCTKENGRSFVVINQKGIDPIALEMLAKNGIFALRRAKKRNMERLVLACGGEAVNSVDGLTPEVLGEAGRVHETQLGDDKYTFVEQVKKGASCTILIKGQNDHTISQLKDAVRDGLRAVKNVFDDKCVVPGAGAFEVALHAHLMRFAETVPGKTRLGVRAYADAFLIIPKTLAENAGHDVQAAIISVQEANAAAAAAESALAVVPSDAKRWSGVSLVTGAAMDPTAAGVLDNAAVKKALLETTGVIASQLLLVDEIMKAGRRGGGGPPQGSE